MNWRDIPTRILLGNPGFEEVWSVVWRAADDKSWTKLKIHGKCYTETRQLHLDERLKHDPTELADTWYHELMHAAFMYWIDKRPRAFDSDLEEKAIRAVCPVLVRALLQSRGS